MLSKLKVRVHAKLKCAKRRPLRARLLTNVLVKSILPKILRRTALLAYKRIKRWGERGPLLLRSLKYDNYEVLKALKRGLRKRGRLFQRASDRMADLVSLRHQFIKKVLDESDSEGRANVRFHGLGALFANKIQGDYGKLFRILCRKQQFTAEAMGGVWRVLACRINKQVTRYRRPGATNGGNASRFFRLKMVAQQKTHQLFFGIVRKLLLVGMYTCLLAPQRANISQSVIKLLTFSQLGKRGGTMHLNRRLGAQAAGSSQRTGLYTTVKHSRACRYGSRAYGEIVHKLQGWKELLYGYPWVSFAVQCEGIEQTNIYDLVVGKFCSRSSVFNCLQRSNVIVLMMSCLKGTNVHFKSISHADPIAYGPQPQGAPNHHEPSLRACLLIIGDQPGWHTRSLNALKSQLWYPKSHMWDPKGRGLSWKEPRSTPAGIYDYLVKDIVRVLVMSRDMPKAYVFGSGNFTKQQYELKKVINLFHKGRLVRMRKFFRRGVRRFFSSHKGAPFISFGKRDWIGPIFTKRNRTEIAMRRRKTVVYANTRYYYNLWKLGAAWDFVKPIRGQVDKTFTVERFMKYYELTLGMLAYRSGLVPTRRLASHLVQGGQVCVNGKIIDSLSHPIDNFDVVNFTESVRLRLKLSFLKSMQGALYASKVFGNLVSVKFLEVNYAIFGFTYISQFFKVGHIPMSDLRLSARGRRRLVYWGKHEFSRHKIERLKW